MRTLLAILTAAAVLWVSPARSTDATTPTTEVWRLGGIDDESVIFASITHVARGDDGRTYLLDAQIECVHVIDSDGQYAGSIGRSGEGPAEFRRPTGLALLPDDLLCISQVVPARLVLIRAGGEAAGDHPLPRGGGSPFLNGCLWTDAGLVLSLGEMTQTESQLGLRTYFARIDDDGEIAVTYWEKTQTADFANIEFDEKTDAGPVWTVSPDGRFFVNDDWDAYRIEVVGAGGEPAPAIEREYEHLPRPEAELEQVKVQMERGEISRDTRIAETARDVVDLYARPDGSLWVLTGTGLYEAGDGAVATFDEFDGNSEFVRSVTVGGVFRPDRDVFFVVDDVIIVVTNSASVLEDIDATAEVEVVCLRMEGD